MLVKRKIETSRNMSEYTYEVLRDNIVNLILKPGRKISEAEISDNLQVSRTPVREAIIRLAQEGMCEVQPQRGTFVSKIDASLVEEFRFVRRTLELRVISLALQSFSPKNEEDCRNILERHKQIPKEDSHEHIYYDELFHRLIYSSCQKERTWDMIKAISWDYSRVRYLALVDFIKNASIIEDHEAILNALVRKDEQAAVEATQVHLDRWLGESVTIGEHHKEYFKVSPLSLDI